MNPIENIWPPVYTLKRHRRAKNVKLRASALYGLEITVPQRFSLKHLPAILDEHREWILKKIKDHSKQLSLPNEIVLHALNEIWQIHYIAKEYPVKLQRKTLEKCLILSGEIENQLACKQKILAWLKLTAKRFLSARIHEISQQTGLTFSLLSIRQQKTLWGSCTIDKKINLNMKLIFLPLPLVDHIIIHELCHTLHLNHSDAFWNLVRRFDPLWKQHRAQMRTADEYIPPILL